jgi:hypothetical protein
VVEPQRGELFVSADEEWIGSDDDPAGSQLNEGREGRLDVAIGAGTQNMELQPTAAGCSLQAARQGLGIDAIGRVDEGSHDGDRGD